MLTLYDEFAGWGGSSQGATAVPGVELVFAANHDRLAVDVHSLNFPRADHYLGDVAAANIAQFPRADIFWSSPACPAWTDARGVRRDFDRSTQTVLFGEGGPDQATARSRALMEEIPRYLEAMSLRGKPVLAGVVENVVQCRKWDQWRRWLGEIRALGYRTRVIALNSMHAQPVSTRRAPQSRDRLYVAYWLEVIPEPDWDKWLRPRAWCPACDERVNALQAFKQLGVDMGRYGRHGQYYYRCPRRSCRHRILEPEALPALAAIDLTLPLGPRIGDRDRPLTPATMARIGAALQRHALPMMCPVGGTWRTDATRLVEPMPTRTSREADAVVVPPLLVPVEGRGGVRARPVTEPARTQTARLQDALVVPLRRSGVARPAGDAPLNTITAGGEHHALVMRHNTPRGDPGQMGTPVGHPLRTLTAAGHQSLITWVYAYDTGALRPGGEPLPTQTSVSGDAFLTAADLPVRVEDCTFRMLHPREIAAGMAFAPDYQVLGDRRSRIAGYGRAVTPPAAEVIVSALVEAITGEAIPTT